MTKGKAKKGATRSVKTETAPPEIGKPSASTDLAIVRGELGKIIIDMLHTKEQLAKIESGLTAANNHLMLLSQRLAEKRSDLDGSKLEAKIDDLKSDINVLKVLIRQGGGSKSFME